MTRKQICYFDNNATTRVAPEVVDAMLPLLRDLWGNPSSAYGFGKEAGKCLEEARTKVAALIQADPKEVIFTSCATESNNTAIHSALAANPGKRHIVTTAVEHPAVLYYCEVLLKQGCRVTYLPVDTDGALDLDLLDKSIQEDTAVVSVMWANNETGVIFPIKEIAAICRGKNVLFHTDATQVPGRLEIDVHGLGVDFLSLSAHKLHAPKGVGLLYVKRRVKYQPHLIGGHQERGRRGGTENVAGIVGFGRAAELAAARLQQVNTRVRALRDRLENAILSGIPNTTRVGAKEPRLPNTSNIAFESAEAEGILHQLDQLGICVSSGSACTTGSLNPSHVLTAMGLKPEQARGCVRISLGVYNTDEEVDYFLKHLPRVVTRLREKSPVKAKTAGRLDESAGQV
jgi:cysteine desulfurase